MSWKKSAIAFALMALICATASAQTTYTSLPPPTGKTWDEANAPFWEHTLAESADKGVCETGQAQSPIPLASAGTALPALQFNYDFDPVNPWVLLRKTDHNYEYVLDPDQYKAGTIPNNVFAKQGAAEMARRGPYPTAQNRGITRNGKFYKLVQLHFHHPSEHTLDGLTFPLEMHLVHQDEDRKNKVVVAVFLTAEGSGPANGMFTFLWGPGWSMGWSHVGSMIPAEGQRTYRRYSGSLTTPPCTQDIEWIVFTTPVKITQDNIDMVARRTSNPFNARPMKDVNNRTID